MGNKAHIEDNKLIIELDETTEKILQRAFPFISALVLQALSMATMITIILITRGKEEVASYRERIAAGENPEKVARDLVSDSGISFEELVLKLSKDIEFPTDEEAEKMLGW